MKIEEVSDDLMIIHTDRLHISLRKTYIEIIGTLGEIVRCDKTFYSKKFVCLKTMNKEININQKDLPRSKRYGLNQIETATGKFIIIVFPGIFKYDRMIVTPTRVCVEHSRDERVSRTDESIIILF